jgi:hypothetical protein
MAKKVIAKETVAAPRLKSSALLNTRVVYCGDNLEQLAKLPDACVDLIYIDPPFNSNRNYGPCRTGQHRGETREKRAFEDRHESTAPTLTTCARAACNWPAPSNRPAGFITTVTGTPAITSKAWARMGKVRS